MPRTSAGPKASTPGGRDRSGEIDGEDEDEPRGVGLAAILAVALASGVVLAANRQNRLPEEDRWVMLLPKSRWGFGPDYSDSRWAHLQLYGGVARLDQYRLGIFAVRVECAAPVIPQRFSIYRVGRLFRAICSLSTML